MDNVKDNSYYLSKILTDVSFVIAHTQEITLEDLTQNEVLLDSVMFRMVQIAESASKLTTEFKRKYGSVDWQAINGMRNRIVHDYGKVDVSIIYQTVTKDLPKLKEYLSAR